MSDVTITYNERDLRKARKLLAAVPNGMPKVMSRSINKTTTAARTKIVRLLASKTKIKQKTIRQAIRFYKASYRKWRALLRISGRGISILRLKARQTKKGVTYANPKTGSRELIQHAFIAVMPQGGSGVFLRLTKARLPIEKQYAPSLSKLYKEAPDLVSRIQSETAKDLNKNVMTQIRLVLDKAKR